MSLGLEAEPLPGPEVETVELPLPVESRSLGTRLREAREASGNSIADVVQVIRFSAHQIEALERDEYASLPGPTSVRGLVRNYAKFLKLDAAPLIAMLEPAVPVPEADVRPPTNMGEAEQPGMAERMPSRLIGAFLVAVVLIAAGYWYFDTVGENIAVQRPAVTATEPARAAVIPPAPGATEVVAAPSATVNGAAGPVASAEGSSPPASGGLRIEFDDRSWIEVRDANQKVVLVGEYAAGTRHSVDGKPPYQLWIGRASGVRVFMGERSIDLKPHTREEVARFSLE